MSSKDVLVKGFCQKFLQFVEASPTPFHCVETSKSLLERSGFVRLSDRVLWNSGGLLKPGGKYYYTHNDSSLVAFCVGGRFEAGKAFKVVGAHTDSPVLKVKPNASRCAHGYLQVGVETYGGGLWHTWLDRDLGVAGRVIVQEGPEQFEQRLVRIGKPILRVPSLCIHLQTAQERKSLEVNKENHLTPILAVVEEQLNGKGNGAEQPAQLDGRLPPVLLAAVAEDLGCDAKDIVDFELTLFDTQAPVVGGINEEFLFSPRIDNQSHAHSALQALVDYSGSDMLAKDEDVSIAVLFDHEEVGSDSASGAGSPIMRDAVIRISECFAASTDSELFKVGISKSLVLSADAAHGIHPNYASKHESKHQPKLGAGTVIKTNSNQRYATNAVTGFIVRELCRRNDIPVQEFVVRNDCPCGSTIGPIIATNTGMRTVDIGIPQLSMHSIRETCNTVDLYTNYQLMLAFYKEGRKVDDMLKSSSF